MHPDERHGAREREDELNDLRPGEQRLPPRAKSIRANAPERREEVVGVHHDVDRGVRQQRDVLEALHAREPEVCHHEHERVVKHVQERQRAAFQDEERGVQELVEFA
eukprot:31279-Pelagococcus_subviridis.AAC.5